MRQIVVGIDPGLKGALAWRRDSRLWGFKPMPVVDNEIDFTEVLKLLKAINPTHAFLERAVSFGMGLKGAFSYGRGFGFIELALRQAEIPVTHIEPGKWAKLAHEGISKDLKPKVKSAIAVKRLLPQTAGTIPVSKNGTMHDGIVDALLIAFYGVRTLNKTS